MPPERRVGMEIEFDSRFVSRERLYAAFGEEIRAKSNYPVLRDEGPDSWTLKSDYSCGWEITSPAIPFTEMGVREISRVIRSVSHRLPDNICTSRCGIHVHVEGGALNLDQIYAFFKMWYDLEPAVWSLHAPNRPEASHIRPLRNYGSNRHCEGFIATGHSDTVNIRGSYQSPHRYEVRYCQSTVDADDIQFWLMTILYLVTLGERASELTVPYVRETEPSELQSFIWNNLSRVGWLDNYRPDLVAWMTRRHEKMHHNNIIPSGLDVTAYVGKSK